MATEETPKVGLEITEAVIYELGMVFQLQETTFRVRTTESIEFLRWGVRSPVGGGRTSNMAR
jgi:hypothetical protein